MANTMMQPRAYWLIALPVLAWLGNMLYAAGAPGGFIKEYSPAIVASALIAYVILHGRQLMGGKALWRFVSIVFAIAWIAETISVLTGFPFGRYHYTEIMAPYIWHVPVFVLPAYALMGYASWALATLLLGPQQKPRSARFLIATPLLAASAMVIWDLSMDPLRATLEGRWIWLDGGAHYGIPLSNYFGWFGVTWLMFQTFALSQLFASKQSGNSPSTVPQNRGFWLSVPIAYSAFAGEYLFNPLLAPATQQWVAINNALVPTSTLYTDVAWLCALTMIPLAALGLRAAWSRIRQEHAATLQLAEKSGP